MPVSQPQEGRARLKNAILMDVMFSPIRLHAFPPSTYQPGDGAVGA